MQIGNVQLVPRSDDDPALEGRQITGTIVRDARVISVVLLTLLMAGFLISEVLRPETGDRLKPECQLQNITEVQAHECTVTTQMQARTRSFQPGG
jgi:hypothetical protein